MIQKIQYILKNFIVLEVELEIVSINGNNLPRKLRKCISINSKFMVNMNNSDLKSVKKDFLENVLFSNSELSINHRYYVKNCVLKFVIS